MADSHHIIDGKVVPYSGGRKCNDTDAWRDATPLELQLQEQLAEYEHATAAKDAEIEALRAEVERANGWNERVSVCRDHVADIVDGPCVICALDAAEARADKLKEVLRRYRNEVPLGHQPHMLAHVVDDMLNHTAAQEGKESFWPKLPGSGGPDWTGHD